MWTPALRVAAGGRSRALSGLGSPEPLVALVSFLVAFPDIEQFRE